MMPEPGDPAEVDAGAVDAEAVDAEAVDAEAADTEAPDSDQRPEGDGIRDAVASGISLGRKALDLLVFAPAGLVATAVEELPDMVVKGRNRFELQFRNARFVGQLVVTRGQDELRDRFKRSVARRPPERESGEAPAGGSPRSQSAPSGWTGVEPIPGYDTLSASQVVRRLDGLGEGELQAIVSYEGTNRGRRTILHRAQQLLGVEELPGHEASGTAEPGSGIDERSGLDGEPDRHGEADPDAPHGPS